METDLIPEMFEEVINNFILTNKDSIVKYVKVNDIDVDYPEGWGEQRYILNVDVYVKEGLLGENGLKGFGPNVAWNSFEKNLEKNTIFKNYLGLPENKDYNDFRVSLVGNFREGLPKKKIDLQEQIRRILREESHIPLVIRRRTSAENIEEAFEDALDRMGDSMENPDSILYKEKGTPLWLFAKFVIDEMVTYLEQDYFTDDNRIYFEDDDFYYDKIRKPLLRHYGSRIKERYYEII